MTKVFDKLKKNLFTYLKKIISGIQFNVKKQNKKLKHFWFINKKVSIKYYLCIYSKLIFQSTISRDHLQSKINYSKMRSLKKKTVKNFTMFLGNIN